jgi:ClpX C4-type zinc finger
MKPRTSEYNGNVFEPLLSAVRDRKNGEFVNFLTEQLSRFDARTGELEHVLLSSRSALTKLLDQAFGIPGDGSRCAFCGTPRKFSRRLVTFSGSAICDHCLIRSLNEIVRSTSSRPMCVAAALFRAWLMAGEIFRRRRVDIGNLSLKEITSGRPRC